MKTAISPQSLIAKLRTRRLGYVAAALAALLLSACASQPPPDDTAVDRPRAAPSRILFVGNSYLYYNDSLHNHVKRIAEELGPHAPEDYEYKSATISGASLDQHPLAELLQPGRLGVAEPFELVILQGGSFEPLSEERRRRFMRTAARFDEHIRASGAATALYMTHAYRPPHARYEPTMVDAVATLYVQTGASLGAMVIPVGIAFERAYAERPNIELHKSFDGSHPSLLGTYLAAYVVYASVYRRPIQHSRYDYYGAVAADDAAFLRRIAAETVSVYFSER